MIEPQMILFEQIRNLVEQARGRAARAVNQTMVETYWHIGRLIVEEEQGGEGRAVYGARLIPELSRRLTLEYGKGFDESNLRNMRRFYLAFPNQIQDAVRLESSPSSSKGHAVRAESPEVPKLAIPNEKSSIPITSFLRSELRWTHYRTMRLVHNQLGLVHKLGGRSERVLNNKKTVLNKAKHGRFIYNPFEINKLGYC